MMSKFFKREKEDTPSVHLHGISYAFYLTVWRFFYHWLLVQTGLYFTLSDRLLFWLYALTSVLFFALACYMFARKSGKTTFLHFLNVGIIVSFFYPFFHAFTGNILNGTPSIYGVDIREMVRLMLLSVPAAFGVWLYFKNKRKEPPVTVGREDILDDF